MTTLPPPTDAPPPPPSPPPPGPTPPFEKNNIPPTTPTPTTTRRIIIRKKRRLQTFLSVILTPLQKGFRHGFRQWRILLLGQILSFLFAGTGATSATLYFNCNVSTPAFQSLLLYVALYFHVFGLVFQYQPIGEGDDDDDDDESGGGVVVPTTEVLLMERKDKKRKDVRTRSDVLLEEGERRRENMNRPVVVVDDEERVKNDVVASASSDEKKEKKELEDTRKKRSNSTSSSSSSMDNFSASVSSRNTTKITNCSNIRLDDNDIGIHDDDDDDDEADEWDDDTHANRYKPPPPPLQQQQQQHNLSSRTTGRQRPQDQEDSELLSRRTGGYSLLGLMTINGPPLLYLTLALVDVEANYFTFLSYRYTTFTSISIFDSLSIPSAMLISRLALGRRYLFLHVAGAVVCMIGTLLNVLSDYKSDDDISQGGGNVVDVQEEVFLQKYPNKVYGDALAITGGILYGLNAVLAEFAVKTYGGQEEYLAMLGLFGTLISSVQVVAFEREELGYFFAGYQGGGDDDDAAAATTAAGGEDDYFSLYNLQQQQQQEEDSSSSSSFFHHEQQHDMESKCNNTTNFTLLGIYVITTYITYVGVARFLTVSESALLKLSLLTGDLWAVLFTVFAEHFMPKPLFWFALILIISGIFVYEIEREPQVLSQHRHHHRNNNNAAAAAAADNHDDDDDDDDGNSSYASEVDFGAFDTTYNHTTTTTTTTTTTGLDPLAYSHHIPTTTTTNRFHDAGNTTNHGIISYYPPMARTATTTNVVATDATTTMVHGGNHSDNTVWIDVPSSPQKPIIKPNTSSSLSSSVPPLLPTSSTTGNSSLKQIV